jgi:hypothetical protein
LAGPRTASLIGGSAAITACLDARFRRIGGVSGLHRRLRHDTTRRVCRDATIYVEGVRYSSAHELVDTRLWARFHGDELTVTAVDAANRHSLEVARPSRGSAGTPVLDDAHHPRLEKESDRTPEATNTAFLMIGPGAAT